MSARTIRIGAGAGFSGDRIEPAVELLERADLDYLVFECLAERTIALAQAARRGGASPGYDPHLERRMRAVLPKATAAGVKIISNMGAANPAAAATAIADIACDLGIGGLTIAAVVGDDVLDHITGRDLALIDRHGTVADIGGSIISANAYLGATPIVEALGRGADIVVTGRVSDAALFLAPMIHAFEWRNDDWDRLAQGTLVGHLLECAGQLTGGYFADPGMKDVAGLARLGFPFAEVREDGAAVFAKVEGSGGELSVATAKEQLLYELFDPSHYVQPDVVADFTKVRIQQVGPNRIEAIGATGKPRPESYKVSVGYRDGFVGEGQIAYAGPNAAARARLALEIVSERLRSTGVSVRDLRTEIVGLNAVDRTGQEREAPPREVRARVVARCDDRWAAERVGAEVEALYTNGPSGGGGVAIRSSEATAIASVLLPRDEVRSRIVWERI